MSPVVFAENDWAHQDQRTNLATLLATEVELVENFEALVGLLGRFASEPAGAVPVVVLDPGIPGVCRLDAVRRTILVQPVARIVVWSGSRDPSFHAAALLDGATASLPKVRPLEVLAEAVRRATAGRLWCEPDQAQWFLDFIAFAKHCDMESRTAVWQQTELKRLQHIEEYIEQLRDVAEGEPFANDDRWFQNLLAMLRPLWLAPYLRRTLIALALHKSRKAAAEALATPLTTVNGYCTRLSGRLDPAHHLARFKDSSDLVLLRWLVTNHNGCELPLDEHDLSREAFDGLD